MITIFVFQLVLLIVSLSHSNNFNDSLLLKNFNISVSCLQLYNDHHDDIENCLGTIGEKGSENYSRLKATNPLLDHDIKVWMSSFMNLMCCTTHSMKTKCFTSIDVSYYLS